MKENCHYNNITNSENDLCFEGHTGALCEQCDLFNVR
jgi:hypothetical protein